MIKNEYSAHGKEKREKEREGGGRIYIRRVAQGKLIIVMTSTRRNNQFSISTRDHCYFS